MTVPESAIAPAARWRIDVDHFQVGGLQEFFDRRRTRPFLTGLLGLTRYAADGDNEIRFTASAGGGVKLMPVPRFGLRLDGRLFVRLSRSRAGRSPALPGFAWSRSTPTLSGRRNSPRRWLSGFDRRRGLVVSREDA